MQIHLVAGVCFQGVGHDPAGNTTSQPLVLSDPLVDAPSI